ncbi:MAG: serine/threonine protein kinase [Polyangiales bacterium]|jgi:serine/threonine protein kinase
MGRYELLFRIAAGGMAEVFAARVKGEAGFEKLVAVKRMLPTLADDEEFVTMFLDEARLAANISSPYVVQTLDLGRDGDGALFIAMELIVGVTLSRIMKEASKVRRAVPVPMAIELLAQTAEGLHAAHVATTPIGQALDIIHRDVSPQNILVGVDGRARLTDFGVARAVLRSTKTDAGRIKGKFAYCAPEQLRSEYIDQRADIFSLGVVSWEALAGQRLFVADHPLATMERVTTMPVLPLHQVRAKVPEGVSAVIDKALQRDPNGRQNTAREFAQELRSAAIDAGLQLPVQSDISRFVKAAGGAPLKKMRSNIQEALAGGPSDVGRLDEPSMISSTGTADTDLGDGVRSLSEEEPDASGIARIPGSLIPQAVVPAAKSNAKYYAVSAAAVLICVALGAGFALGGAGEQDPALVSTPLPPENSNEAMIGGPIEVTIPEVAIPEEVVAVDPEVEALDEEIIEAAPARRRRWRRRATPMNTIRMTETATTNTTRMSEPRVTAPRMTEPVVEAAPRMNGPLVGIDAFDRELGN